LEFLSFDAAMERLGKRIHAPDWYIDHGAPSTAVEMQRTWLADGLLRKYRASCAAGQIYAAVRGRDNRLDVYDNARGTPALAPELASYFGDWALAIQANLKRCLEAVRCGEVVGISMTPQWWSAHDKGHTTLGFDLRQFDSHFGLGADGIPMNALPASKAAVEDPSANMSPSKGVLVHRVDSPNPMHALARSLIDRVLSEHPDPKRSRPAEIRNLVWTRLSELTKSPGRPNFLLKEIPGNRKKKTDAEFQYELLGNVEAYSASALYELTKKVLKNLKESGA
jgi:hypothetical protein